MQMSYGMCQVNADIADHVTKGRGSTKGGGGGCGEINIFRLNFHEINNCLKVIL